MFNRDAYRNVFLRQERKPKMKTDQVIELLTEIRDLLNQIANPPMYHVGLQKFLKECRDRGVSNPLVPETPKDRAPTMTNCET